MKEKIRFFALAIVAAYLINNLAAQSCVTPPPGLVSWWPAEGSSSDLVGLNNGILEGNASFVPGQVGQALNFNGVDADVRVPASASLDIGAYGAMTIEGWIKPVSVAEQMPIVEWNSGTYCAQLWISVPVLGGGNGPGSLFANLVDTTGTEHKIASATNIISATSFQHVAVTYDKADGYVTLYLNGMVVAQQDMGQFTPLTSADLYFGYRPAGGAAGTRFAGQMDELSLYNRALSSTEIQSIYTAGSAGKCTSIPIPPNLPAVYGLTPTAGAIGTMVNIAGTNFDAISTNNIIYFGAVKTVASSASPTNLTVAVPAGATYGPVTVTVAGLTAASGQLFEPTFTGNGSNITSSSFAPGFNLDAPSKMISSVIADLDGDGKPDIALVGVGFVSVFRNTGSNGAPLDATTFAPRVDLPLPAGTGDNAYKLRVADLDGDGRLDLMICEIYGNTVSVFHNIATSGSITTNSFEPIFSLPAGNDCRFATAADLDGDGRLDIVALNYGDNTLSILKNIGTPGSLAADSFAPPVTFACPGGPYEATTADLDGDGRPDIAVVNYDNSTVSIFQNQTSQGWITANSFATHIDLAAGTGPTTITAADLDGDGKLDLVTGAVQGYSTSVHRNMSLVGLLTTNSFSPRVDFSTPGWTHDVAVADFDGDGKPDISAVGELSSFMSIFQNNSLPGGFTDASLDSRVDFGTGWNAWGIAAGDLNGDGRPDIVFCNYYDSSITIYPNQASFGGPVAPFIVTQPGSQTVAEGGEVDLSVVAGGTGPFSYQWSLNATNLPGATNDTLILDNLHSWQAGNYSVMVTTAAGDAASSNAVVTVTDQNILIYRYTGNEKITTVGQSPSFNYSGQFFFNPDTTNGTFVGWGNFNGKKQYWISPFSNYLVLTIPGNHGQTFTLWGKAGQSIDEAGHPRLWTYLHKGLNARLPVGGKQYVSFPHTLSATTTHVYPNENTGDLILSETKSTFTFQPQDTQAANKAGQTAADLVNDLIQNLTHKGYQKQ